MPSPDSLDALLDTQAIRDVLSRYCRGLDRMDRPMAESVWHEGGTADYVGIYSGRDENKFEALGLTPVASDTVHAPYPKEFPLVLECRIIHTIPIGLHTQFIGEIVDVKADEAVLADGKVDIAKVDPFVFSPADRGYYRVGEFLAPGFAVGKKP